MCQKPIHVKIWRLNRIIDELIYGNNDRLGLVGVGKIVTILSRDVVSG